MAIPRRRRAITERVLTLNPSYNPALLRLGSLELTLDHPDAAKDSFTKAMAQRHSSAALTGLGKVALTGASLRHRREGFH